VLTPLRLLLLASLASTPSLAAECPQSCVSFCYASPVCTTDSTGEAGYYGDVGSFDIPNGSLATQSSCGLSNCCSHVTVDEEFVLGGLPVGTSLTITARLEATLEMWQGYGGGGGAEARITDLIGGEAHWVVASPDTGVVALVRDSVLTLPLSVQAGIPFRTTFEVRCATAEMIASARGVFSFDGLPPQSSIVSCRGFTQIPVPTSTTTWGGVKARYR
jgi:hypothetical protein